MKEIAKLYWDGLYGDRMNDCSLRVFTGAIDLFTELKNHPTTNDVVLRSKSILEYGCGTGELGRIANLLIPGVEYTGVDISEKAIKYAMDHYGSPTIHYTTVLEAISVDLAMTSNTLEHFHRPFPIIDMLLDRSNYLLVQVPYNQQELDRYDAEGGAGHAFTFTEKSFANYNVVDSFTFFTHTWVQGPSPLQLVTLLTRRKAQH